MASTRRETSQMVPKGWRQTSQACDCSITASPAEQKDRVPISNWNRKAGLPASVVWCPLSKFIWAATLHPGCGNTVPFFWSLQFLSQLSIVGQDNFQMTVRYPYIQDIVLNKLPLYPKKLKLGYKYDWHILRIMVAISWAWNLRELANNSLSQHRKGPHLYRMFSPSSF